jgi:radical SAM superfamily enzyme YgiQ (UPF0313 family)
MGNLLVNIARLLDEEQIDPSRIIPRAIPRRVPRDLRLPPTLDPRVRPVDLRMRYTLLINPFYPKDPNASFGKHVLTPTLALTSIAGATPPNWCVRYWDENLLQGPPPWRPFPRVVGITVHLTFAQRAYELAGWYRRRGALIVLGGLHVLSCPQEVQPHADAIAIGEGVQLWTQILRDVEAGELKKVYRAGYSHPYHTDPAPRRALLPRRSFLTTSSLIATRGCHSRCGFCYLSTKGLQMPYQMLQTNQVVEQFAADRQPYGVFIDNNLGSRPEYLADLCRAMRPLNKIWSAAVSIDVTDDPAVVREMALAGCIGVFVGFESLTDHNLIEARKKTPRCEDYARRVDILHRWGIQVNGSFVLGFDHDGPEVFWRTIDWVEQNRLECATFHILTPYPGTPLFAQMERDGRLLHRDWSRYDTSHVVFRPKLMSPRQLENGYAWCYRRLFSSRSIWRRRPRDSRSVPGYLAMSYLYKKSNWLWPFLIRSNLTAVAWRPLMELNRLSHLAVRHRLQRESELEKPTRFPMLVSAGV